MLIVYATFTTIVCYLAMIPIYYFQPLESDKGTVQCCFIVVVNLVNLILLYGKKTLDIFLQSEKNTKEYVKFQLQDPILRCLNSKSQKFIMLLDSCNYSVSQKKMILGY